MPAKPRGRGPSLLLCVAAALLAAGLSSCATIRLNRAMERIHTDYVELFDDVEAEDPTRIYFSARALSARFDDPAVSGYSSDADFRGHLEDSREILDEFATGVGNLEPRPSRRLRKRLFETCQACHRDYRR